MASLKPQAGKELGIFGCFVFLTRGRAAPEEYRNQEQRKNENGQRPRHRDGREASPLGDTVRDCRAASDRQCRVGPPVGNSTVEECESHEWPDGRNVDHVEIDHHVDQALAVSGDDRPEGDRHDARPDRPACVRRAERDRGVGHRPKY